MDKEFKRIIKESKRSLKKMEKNIEERSESFTDEVIEFWNDLKNYLSSVEEKLDDAYDEFEDQAKLKAHLGMMEASERIKKLEDIAYEFSSKVTANTQEELDIAMLRAHLLKMEREDLWTEKQKELLALYEHSKDEAEKVVIKTAKEINTIMLKLTEIV